MTKTFPLAIAALAALPLAAQAQDLVTRDRVGLEDAPNTLTFRLTPYDLYSADPATAEAFEALFAEFIRARPDWKIETQLQTGNIGQEQARLLQQTQAGRGPDCAMVDSSQLALFEATGVLRPMNMVFSEAEVADLFPYVRDAVTNEAGDVLAWWWFTDLRVLYRDTSVVPDAPETWEAAQAAGLAAVEAGREGLLFNGGRWEGTAFDWLANFWAQGGRLVDEAGAPDLRRGREPRPDAGRHRLCAGPGRERRIPAAGHVDHELRRLQRGRRGRVRRRCSWAATGNMANSATR